MLLIRDRSWTLGFASAAVLAGVAFVVAGPLDPPPGPVAPSYKTLAEVEPRTAINSTNTPGDEDSTFKITQPGSYYLTANLDGASGKRGIEIAASDVTVDLNGYTVQGVTGALDGIACTLAGASSVTVLNGTIRSWPKDGLNFSSVGVRGGRVEGVIAEYNGVDGIKVGSEFFILGCSALSNGLNGIGAAYASTITQCAVRLNTGAGVSCLDACAITACAAYYNGSYGFIASEGVCSDCVAFENSSDGFRILSGGTIINCSSSRNDGSGFSIGTRCTITNCSASANAVGAAAGANIKITGGDNHVQQNNCVSGLRGIQAVVAGNIIVRNTCSGNTTNWDIVAGNALAPIISATTNASTVVGNTYTGNLGSSDANANFTY